MMFVTTRKLLQYSVSTEKKPINAFRCRTKYDLNAQLQLIFVLALI